VHRHLSHGQTEITAQATETHEERADYAANGLPDAISAWLESSRQVRVALDDLLAGASGHGKKA